MEKKLANSNKITVYNILSTFVLQGLTFFTAPIISRMLGAANYGICTVYITWVSVFAIIFGAQTQSTIAVSRSDYPTEGEQKRYQSSIMFLSLCIYSLFAVISIILIRPISKLLRLESTVVLLMVFHSFGMHAITFTNNRFTYEFKAKWNFVLTLIVSSTTIGLSIILIKSLPKETNYWGRLIGLGAPYMIIGYGLCFITLLKGKTFYNKEYWRYCIPLCLPIILHQISSLILNQSDRVMLQHMIDNSSVGIYSLACSFSAVLSTIWNALNNSWVPFYYEYTRKKQEHEMLIHAKNYMELFTVISVGFVLLATEVFHVFAGKEFWSGTNLIYIFSIGYYFVFLYSFPVNYEFYKKKTKHIAMGTCIAAVCNIFLNSIMIRMWGIAGAAIATSAAHGIQFLFHHYIGSKVIKGSGDYPFSLKMIVPYFLGFVIFCSISQFYSSIWWVRWGMGMIIGLFEMTRILKRKAIF